MEVIGQTAACACAMGITLTIAEHIVPSEVFQKQLRLLFSMIFLLGLLLSLGSRLSSLPDAVRAAQTAAAPTEEIFAQMVEDETATQLCLALRQELEQNGISVQEITADAHISADGRITISAVRLSCTEQQRAEQLLVPLLGESVPIEFTEDTE